MGLTIDGVIVWVNDLEALKIVIIAHQKKGLDPPARFHTAPVATEERLNTHRALGMDNHQEP